MGDVDEEYKDSSFMEYVIGRTVSDIISQKIIGKFIPVKGEFKWTTSSLNNLLSEGIYKHLIHPGWKKIKEKYNEYFEWLKSHEITIKFEANIQIDIIKKNSNYLSISGEKNIVEAVLSSEVWNNIFDSVLQSPIPHTTPHIPLPKMPTPVGNPDFPKIPVPDVDFPYVTDTNTLPPLCGTFQNINYHHMPTISFIDLNSVFESIVRY